MKKSSRKNILGSCPLSYYRRTIPNHLALIEEGYKSWTYQELDDAVIWLINFLLDYKVSQSKLTNRHRLRVGLYLDSSSSYVVLLIALYRLGWTAVPLNKKKPITQVAEDFKEFDGDILVASAKSLASLDNLNLKVDLIDLVIERGILKNNQQTNKEISHKCFDKININFRATYLMTSGSMGRSKVAVFSLQHHLERAEAANQFASMKSGDLVLLQLPLYHVSGLSVCFRSLVGGACLYLANTAGLDVIQMASLVVREKVTHLSLVPAQLKSLVIHLNDNQLQDFFKSIESLLLGGAPIPDDLLILTKRFPISPTYGMTESNAQIATYNSSSINSSLNALESRFLDLLPKRKVKVVDGELFVHKDSLFMGYLKNGRLVKPWKKDWFATGDLAELSREGGKVQLKIIGRKDRMFVSGGENIYPEEIERWMSAMAEIVEARVMPVEDKMWGKVPTAIVRLGQGKQKTNKFGYQEIVEHLNLSLEKYKIPQRVYVCPEKTTINKQSYLSLTKYLKPKNILN